MSESATSVLGTYVQVLGLAAGVLTLADWVLPKAIKDWIKDKAETAWIWLSYQKTWPYIRRLRRSKQFNTFTTFSVILIISMISYSIASSIVSPRELVNSITDKPLLLSVAMLILASPLITLYLFRRSLLACYLWITNNPHMLSYTLKSFGVFSLSAIIATAISSPPLLYLFSYILKSAEAVYYKYLLILLAFILWNIEIVAFIFAIVFFFVVLYMCVVYGLIAAFRVLEFILLRIAEHDKGPLLAVEAVIAAIGTILKEFVA